jgi:uncharacterized protein
VSFDLRARAGVPFRARSSIFEADHYRGSIMKRRISDTTSLATKSVGPSAETDAAAIHARVDGIDWTQVHADLNTQGWAVVPKLLTHAEADAVAGFYPLKQGFRSHVVMARHGFGRGEYKYFSYPLPPLIQALRTAAYPHLVTSANQ